MKNYLTIGTLWKNEASYAEDFLTYHRKVGVEKFVIFDREYNNLFKLIGHYPDVEIIHFPESPENNHMAAFGKLIEHNKDKTFWLALIDADQCLTPVKYDNVCDVLKEYEDFASLQLNWRSFGSGGQETRVPGSIYERFTLTCDDQDVYNYHTQVICQPNRILPKLLEPHYVLLPEGEVAVNTNKEIISSDKVVSLNPNTPLSFNVPALHDVMYVNHYTNKSKEEWLIKNSKGRADIFGLKMPTQQFEEYELVCNKKEDLIALNIFKSQDKEKIAYTLGHTENYNKYLKENDKLMKTGARYLTLDDPDYIVGGDNFYKGGCVFKTKEDAQSYLINTNNTEFSIYGLYLTNNWKTDVSKELNEGKFYLLLNDARIFKL